MTNVLRTLSKAAVTALSRPSTPSAMATVVQDAMSPLVSVTRGFAAPAAKLKKDCVKKRPTINCACARHPWPEDDKECEEVKEKPKDCDFDFRKLEVNPFDPPCDCQDPPPAAGCADVGRPKEICCRSFRQYGCHCEVEEECEEEVEEVYQKIEAKTCELDFKKLEVNPYDDPCECRDAPPVARCADLPKKDLCCRTKKLFTCNCEAYDEPGLECLKQKVPKSQRTEAKKCDKKEWKGKCM